MITQLAENGGALGIMGLLKTWHTPDAILAVDLASMLMQHRKARHQFLHGGPNTGGGLLPMVLGLSKIYAELPSESGPDSDWKSRINRCQYLIKELQFWAFQRRREAFRSVHRGMSSGSDEDDATYYY